MSALDGNYYTSSQDDLEDIDFPTEMIENIEEVKGCPIPIENKCQCREPHNNPQPPYKKFTIDPVTYGIGNEEMYSWHSQQPPLSHGDSIDVKLQPNPNRNTEYNHNFPLEFNTITMDPVMTCGMGSNPMYSWNPNLQDEPLSIGITEDSALGTTDRHGLHSQQMNDGIFKEDSIVVTRTSISDSAPASSSHSQPFVQATVRNGSDELDSSIAHSLDTRGEHYLVAENNNLLTALPPNQSEMGRRMFLSPENRFLESGLGIHTLHRNKNHRSHSLLHNVTETTTFSPEYSKDIQETFVHGMMQNPDVGSRLPIHASMHNKNRLKVAEENYKIQQRRILKNARNRADKRALNVAFEELRSAIPACSHNEKLSKLAILRMACSYIRTLSGIHGNDNSAD